MENVRPVGKFVFEILEVENIRPSSFIFEWKQGVRFILQIILKIQIHMTDKHSSDNGYLYTKPIIKT